MRLIKTAIETIRRVVAKKLRRRNRTKGARVNVRGRNWETEAEKLIRNNWGVTFKNPPAARAGAKRAQDRLKAKLRQNDRDDKERNRRRKRAPILRPTISRQVRRQAKRLAAKGIAA